MSKSSHTNPEGDLCITHLQHRAAWCWFYWNEWRSSCQCQGSTAAERCLRGGVWVRISAHKHPHTSGKHHGKTRLGLLSSLTCKSSYNFFTSSAKLKLKVFGVLEISSKSRSPFFTSQHPTSIKVTAVESSSLTEVGVALLCFRSWIFSTCPQFSASILKWIFKFPARPK